MSAHFDNPFVIFAIALIVQLIAAYAGDFLRKHAHSFKQGERHDFNTVQAATLTLLVLIIGFTFSMAVSRYDQRKALEEAEANAIGTEYLRADLLTADGGEQVRDVLRKYLNLRIAFYEQDNPHVSGEDPTTQVQKQLWTLVASAAASRPTPTTALAVSGMNDVLNSQGYTQAAWWNRIPVGAWAMMAVMAIFCNLLVGYGERRRGELLLSTFPVIVSVSFFLIADLDSPRGGVIHVYPHNLLVTAEAIRAH